MRLAALRLPPLAPPGALALAAGAAWLGWSTATRGFAGAAVAGADLVFHEAGHAVFAIFGWRFLTILGGTLGQLAFPLVATAVFLLRGRLLSAGATLVWLGLNLVDVGRYAADAEARALPLLADSIDAHDWWNMLGMLGLRAHCGFIGGLFAAAGWALVGAVPALALRLAFGGDPGHPGLPAERPR